MELRNLIKKNRTCRRFHEDVPVTRQQLRELVELARFSASGANLQPIKFMLSADADTNGKIFPHLKWAAYLTDWDGPEEGERPAAYILMLRDREIKDLTSKTDAGVCMQNMLLGATDKGFGGCIFASADREAILDNLGIDKERYEFMYLLAFGKPKEEVVLEDVGADGDIKYYRDEMDRHHVPKRPLDELIIG
jgi:nitroreductase